MDKDNFNIILIHRMRLDFKNFLVNIILYIFN